MFVQTDSLTKRYGDFAALDGCSLTVGKGEVFGLLGPNGAGKTTLLRCLMGFLRPTSGTARIDGKDCHARSLQVRQLTAYLPGDARPFRLMRGRSVLRFFADVRPDGDYERACQVAAQLDLDLSRRVAFMSTGMRQKLALSATLSVDAPLLILDEPTSNLDPTMRGRIADLVRSAGDEGRTVLFSSHVLSEVEEVCDRVAVLRQGRVAHLQEMKELRRRHRIHATLEGQAPSLPPEFEGQIELREAGQLVMETADDVAPLLRWLATLKVREIRVEPLGLRAVYDRCYSADKEVQKP